MTVHNYDITQQKRGEDSVNYMAIATYIATFITLSIKNRMSDCLCGLKRLVQQSMVRRHFFKNNMVWLLDK